MIRAQIHCGTLARGLDMELLRSFLYGKVSGQFSEESSASLILLLEVDEYDITHLRSTGRGRMSVNDTC